MSSDLLYKVWETKGPLFIPTTPETSWAVGWMTCRWFWDVSRGYLCTCLKMGGMDCHKISLKIVALFLHETRINTAVQWSGQLAAPSEAWTVYVGWLHASSSWTAQLQGDCAGQDSEKELTCVWVLPPYTARSAFYTFAASPGLLLIFLPDGAMLISDMKRRPQSGPCLDTPPNTLEPAR